MINGIVKTIKTGKNENSIQSFHAGTDYSRKHCQLQTFHESPLRPFSPADSNKHCIDYFVCLCSQQQENQYVLRPAFAPVNQHANFSPGFILEAFSFSQQLLLS
jgi:hypothetical protein